MWGYAQAGEVPLVLAAHFSPNLYATTAPLGVLLLPLFIAFVGMRAVRRARFLRGVGWVALCWRASRFGSEHCDVFELE